MIRRNPKTDRKVRESKKAIVAMSGGVDSSVAAALLKKAGFSVVGVFMKFWSEPRGGSTRINADSNADLRGYENRCCNSEAEARARKVAKVLKIPFYVFNFEKEFKKRIVDYFLGDYKKGLTPNPCVICNKEIKFGLFLEKALKLGADYVATGHYARKIQNPKSKIQKLLVAKDKAKDQSYFLWQLNQKQLKRILFPVGNYTKIEVKRLARRFKLPTQKTSESMEICFVKNTINDFLQQYLKEKPGQIVDKKGNIIGRHRGLWFYTIGQRKGIGLSGGPYYVLDKPPHQTSTLKKLRKAQYSLWCGGKDLKKNLLIVTRNEKDLNKKELLVKNVNWISGKEPRLPITTRAKIRYRHEPALSRLSKLKTKNYKLVFNKSQRAITPGQSAVFYSPSQILQSKTWEGKGEELLGGGVIVQ